LGSNFRGNDNYLRMHHQSIIMHTDQSFQHYFYVNFFKLVQF